MLSLKMNYTFRDDGKFTLFYYMYIDCLMSQT